MVMRRNLFYFSRRHMAARATISALAYKNEERRERERERERCASNRAPRGGVGGTAIRNHGTSP
jgi:hypothetical protein